jgi:hypothetical protein
LSTSSSDPVREHTGTPRSPRRIPWAGLSAALILLLLDSLFFGRCGPHDLLGQALKSGSIPVRQRLMTVSSTEAQHPRVVTAGTSQMRFAVDSTAAQQLAPDLEFVNAAGAAINPLATRTLVGGVLAVKPALVVLGLSPIDTHSPIRLLQNESAPAASPAALWRVLSIAGPALAVRERNLLFKLLAAEGVGALRYHAAVQALGPREWRSFELSDRFKQFSSHPQLARVQLGGAQTPRLSRDDIERTFDEFPTIRRFAVRGMVQVNDLTGGPHVEVQTALIRDTVRAYHSAGVLVVAVELPIHPIGDLAHDQRNRGAFRRIMEDMARAEGFEFIPLSARSPWQPEEFLDVVHLNAIGAERFTAQLVELSRRLLAERAGSTPD